MEKNPVREKRIYELWKKGYKIAEIAEMTGYPKSSVGYYTKKFKDAEKKRKYSTASLIGPPISIGKIGAQRGEFMGIPIVDAQPGMIYDDIMKPRIKRMSAKIDETPIARREQSLEINEQRQIIIDNFYEKIRNNFTQLMKQGEYMQANDFCGSFLSYINLSQWFADILQGRKKIRRDDYMVLQSIFTREKS